MQTDYQMRALDPGMKAYLSSYFQRSNNELCALLQRKFNWSGAECVV